MMVRHNSGCLGNYDFDNIAHYAKMRFVEGQDTVSLLESAASEREKEEIALACLLDVEDETIRDLKLSSRYESECTLTNCRAMLRQMIEEELAKMANKV